MSTDAVTLLLALLTVASWAASATLVAAHLSGGVRERVHAVLAGQILPLGFLVAAVSMAGSLYLSEVADFVPCNLCWYQRIAMYPLAVLLLLSLVTRSRLDARYIVALAAIGLPISIYHYQLQLFPEQGTVCTGIISCTDRNVEEYGFVSIPFMAGAGFLSILLLQLAVWRTERLGTGEPARS